MSTSCDGAFGVCPHFITTRKLLTGAHQQLLIPFAYDGDALLKAVNDNFPWDIFALKLFGSRHYVLEKPSLVLKISANVKDVVSDDVLFDMIRLVSWRLIRS